MRPNDIDIHVYLSLNDGVIAAGGMLEGVAEIGLGAQIPNHGRLEVLWYTTGQGEPDSGVIYRVELGHGKALKGKEVPFSVTLPPIPRSYEGTLFQVRWMVRIARRQGRRI